MDQIITNVKKTNIGYRIRIDKIQKICYAAVVVLMTENEDHLQHLFFRLKTTPTTFNMKISIQKLRATTGHTILARIRKNTIREIYGNGMQFDGPDQDDDSDEIMSKEWIITEDCKKDGMRARHQTHRKMIFKNQNIKRQDSVLN